MVLRRDKQKVLMTASLNVKSGLWRADCALQDPLYDRGIYRVVAPRSQSRDRESEEKVLPYLGPDQEIFWTSLLHRCFSLVLPVLRCAY